MNVERERESYTVEPFPSIRQQQIDWLDLMQRQHTMHALLEVDITHARRSLKEQAAVVSERVSFTAFIVWCVARAVDADKQMHACRQGRGKLVLFDEVDVTVIVERPVQGKRVPVPCIIRSANTKPPAQIHREIRAAQAQQAAQQQAVRGLSVWLSLPGCLRRLFWTALLRNPHWRKKAMGTVVVSAVGMFGRGPAWGIPLTAHSLCVTTGGVARKPGLASSAVAHSSTQIEPREYLSLTLSMDHDIIDGAPAARFAQHLRELIEAGMATADL